MKKEFKLSEDELQEIKGISQDKEPVMKFGNYWSGNGPQERANAFWKLLGDKHGFVWDTVEGISGKGIEYFSATPK
jgi:hypothetical protein